MELFFNALIKKKSASGVPESGFSFIKIVVTVEMRPSFLGPPLV
jgi:hypothetical protein